MSVTRLKTRPAQEAQLALFELRAAVVDSAIRRDVATKITSLIEREISSQSGWAFVMIEPNLYSQVVRYLAENSRRPVKALRLWADLFTYLPPDSNEVLASREELAVRIGVERRTISEIMGELEEIGAIYRERRGREVHYFVNPKLGTHLGGQARDRAQDHAPSLKLVASA